jgi:outer membrane protein OmpA-like peptidoglycan-associated protein
VGEVRCTLKQAQDGVAIDLDLSTTIVVVPAAAQVTLKGRAFDGGGSFLLPRACSALNDVWAFATRMQAKHAIVVGHVDKTEADPDNLSKTRATLAAAWLAGDSKPWLDQYSADVAETQRWGAREDRYLLSVALSGLPSSTPKEGETGDPRVRAFQTLANIKVDGIAGPVTRAKLIERYFALSRLALLNQVEPPDNGITLLETQIVAHPAGANFTLQQVNDAKKPADNASPKQQPSPTSSPVTESEQPRESQARIDFLFFFSDAKPEPAPGAADGPAFLEWVKQTELQRVAVVNPSGAGSSLFVELWDKHGRTPHKGAKYTLTGPEAYAGTTDSLGRFEHDDVIPGDYALTLTLEFFDGQDKITDEHKASLVVQSGAQPQVRQIGAVPGCKLAQIKGLLFETSKSFLVPEAVDALKGVRQLYEQHKDSELLVVGHTDTMGNPGFNDPLSLERAKATLAYLQDDVNTWLSFYETSVPESRRWGKSEDERMQEVVDNPALNRTELIAAYMALDGAELDAGEYRVAATIHGCGENFPLDDSQGSLEQKPANDNEDASDRRVELFFFEPEFGIVPKPPGENSKKGSTQYPAWRKLAELTLLSEVDARGVLRSTYALDELTELAEEFHEHAFISLLGGIFGFDIPVSAYRKLYAELKDGVFVAPRIVVLDEIEGGHVGAYNRTARVIEVQRQLIEHATSSNDSAHTLMQVLLEEFGHHVDQELRTRLSNVGGDAPLDEGAVFAYNLTRVKFEDVASAFIGTYVVAGVETAIVVDFEGFNARVEEVLHEWEQRNDERDANREFFGAGRGADNGHSFGHQSIEDALQGEFNKEQRQEIYFGNWLRDHSQFLTPLSIRPPQLPREAGGYSVEALTQLLDVLAREHFADDPRFRVTPQRLGVYRYEEHIDNPKGLTDGTAVDARLNRAPVAGLNTVNPETWLMRYIDQDVNGHPSALSYMQGELRAALREGPTTEGRRRFGQSLHVLEDYFSHSNFMELALRQAGHNEVFPFAGRVTIERGTVTPVVTGMFGFDDTAASISYVIAEHMTKSTKCTPGERGPGVRMLLILAKDRYPERTKRLEAALSAKEHFEAANPWFFKTQCEAMDYLFGWVGQSMGQGLHAGASVIDDAQTLFRDNLTTSVDPTHSQLAKDHDDHPLHAIAARCAMVAVRTAGKAMKAAWQKQIDEAKLMAEVSKFFVHPFNRRHTQTDPDVNEVFKLIANWGNDRANANALIRLRSSSIVQHLLTAEQHAHSRDQAREVIREGQKLRHQVRPDTDDGVFDRFFDDLHRLLSQ